MSPSDPSWSALSSISLARSHSLSPSTTPHRTSSLSLSLAGRPSLDGARTGGLVDDIQHDGPDRGCVFNLRPAGLVACVEVPTTAPRRPLESQGKSRARLEPGHKALGKIFFKKENKTIFIECQTARCSAKTNSRWLLATLRLATFANGRSLPRA